MLWLDRKENREPLKKSYVQHHLKFLTVMDILALRKKVLLKDRDALISGVVIPWLLEA
jgi:hypothetical protein